MPESDLSTTAASNLYVVGLGASAGGLQPLEAFFDAMPSGGSIAFVVIQHLSPDFKSLMKELLTRHTQMSVQRVEEDCDLQADTIYLIPPQKNLVLEGSCLRLIEISQQRVPNFAIDVFFESLARAFGPRAIGVVLSGTGTDGSRGIRSIHEAGGIVFVQDVETAQFDGMPRSAIATNAVHSILPPQEIAQSIHNYTKRSYEVLEEGSVVENLDTKTVEEIVAILRLDNGIDFTHYRPATIARRFARRMSLTDVPTPQAYLDILAKDRDERLLLQNDLLIGVTAFFRDPEAWESLRDQYVIPMLETRDDKEPIRVWIAACATGEEVYTMCILLLEAMRKVERYFDVKVFATDIDQRSLQTAAIGAYSANLVHTLPNELCNLYFVPDEDRFRVSRRLREMVIFAEHNLVKDAAFTNMDIVTCRNILIYMEPFLQRNILASLHFALRKAGCLMLGSAETLGDLEREFDPLDGRWKLFRKRRNVRLLDAGATGVGAPTPVLLRRQAAPAAFQIAEQSRAQARFDATAELFRLLVHDRRSAVAILDSDRQVLQTYGKTQDFLRVPEGSGTRDLARLVIPPLSMPLGSAMQQAKETRVPVTYVDLPVEEDQPFRASLVVCYVREDDAGEERYLVLFERTDKDAPQRLGQTFTVSEHVARRVRALEVEVQHSKENLQATIEELEATNEEHQATNEELLAANEELQSTNEELQSVNEELHTVNTEHQSKIRELTDLANDLDNMIGRTDLGVLFLDGAMNVRKFTPFVRTVVNLTETDVGRPIATFSHSTDIPDLWQQFTRVSETGEPWDAPAHTRDGRDVLVRCVPYTTDNQQYSGVMVMFVDSSFIDRAHELLVEVRSKR